MSSSLSSYLGLRSVAIAIAPPRFRTHPGEKLQSNGGPPTEPAAFRWHRNSLPCNSDLERRHIRNANQGQGPDGGRKLASRRQIWPKRYQGKRALICFDLNQRKARSVLCRAVEKFMIHPCHRFSTYSTIGGFVRG